MCYNLAYMEQNRQKWIKRYGEENIMPLLPEPGILSGFKHPMIPVLIKNGQLTAMYWGLVPLWEKSVAIKYNTLNARIEDLAIKPSFRPYVQNRCLVLADGFMEYHWTDIKDPNCKKNQVPASQVG